MANIFAYIMLFGWPLVVLVLYSVRTPAEATICSILGAYLLLPVRLDIDLPLIPPLDKNSVPNLGALAACMLIARARKEQRNRSSGWMQLFLMVYILSPFATAAANGDIVIMGAKILRPMTYYDALSTSIQIIIFNCIPYWLGYTYIRKYEHFKFLFKALVISGLVYSLPILLEVRLSPQLHTWIYGYFPHDFVQMMRFGGFRPVVFLGHGLQVAFFMMLVTAAAAGLWRMRLRTASLPPGLITAYVWVMVVACKSFGAIFYSSFLLFVVRSFRPVTQLRIATAIAVFVLAFPILRITNYFPMSSVVEFASSIDRERAESLHFRFEQEEIMIVRARQRPWFGWGSWGRYRTYSKDTGEDVSVTDSRWFITFGSSGVFGFLAEFGLLLIPVFRAKSALGRGVSVKERTVLSVMSMLLAIIGLESLVNESIMPVTLMLAGGVLRYGEELRLMRRRWRAAQRQAVAAAPDTPPAVAVTMEANAKLSPA